MACVDKRNVDFELFIEEIKKYPCLYSKSHKEYKNIVLKKALWHAIGSIFNITGIEAEKKWRVQRDRYNREKKKIKDSKPTGAGAADVYIPTWEHYHLVGSVFTGAEENSNTISSLGEDVPIISSVYGSQYTVVSEENDIESVLGEEPSQNLDCYAASSFTDVEGEKTLAAKNLATSCSSTPMLPTHLRKSTVVQDGIEKFSSTSLGLGSSTGKKRKKDDDLLSDLRATSKSINNYFLKSSENKEPDLASTFCRYLEVRLRGLKKGRRKAAIYEIEKVVSQKEMEEDDDDAEWNN